MNAKQMHRMCLRKKKFLTIEFAEKVAKEKAIKFNTKYKVYFCPLCGHYHLATVKEKTMKYTPQQEAYIKAGATLCIECKKGYNGDKSCGCNGAIKMSKTSSVGCFCGEKMEKQ